MFPLWSNLPLFTISQSPLPKSLVSINLLPIHWEMPCSYPLICLCLGINYTYRNFSSVQNSVQPSTSGSPQSCLATAILASLTSDLLTRHVCGTCCRVLSTLLEGSGSVLLPSSSHDNWHIVLSQVPNSWTMATWGTTILYSRFNCVHSIF